MGVHTQRKEVPPMSNADAVKKYHQKLDEFKIRPYTEEGQTIREYAAAHGCSVQALFLAAVRDYMAQGKTPEEVKRGRKSKKEE